MKTPRINFDAKPFFMHAFKPDDAGLGKGGATLVAYPYGNYKPRRIIEAKQVYVAIAQCSENDNFNKAWGRELAQDRAVNGDGFMFRFPNDADALAKKELLRNLVNQFDLSMFREF
jgi:hypothetical protein